MIFFSLGISILLLIFVTLNLATFYEIAILIIYIVPLFVIIAVAALIYALVCWRKIGKRAGLPLLIQIIAVLILYGGSTLAQSINLNFRVHVSGFNEVIALAEAGHFQPDDHTHKAELPPEYRYLSQDGTIKLQKENGVTTVLFYESIWFFGEFQGYIYQSNNGPAEDLPWCAKGLPLRQPQTNWFVCVTY
jgi:hypothetical protein